MCCLPPPNASTGSMTIPDSKLGGRRADVLPVPSNRLGLLLLEVRSFVSFRILARRIDDKAREQVLLLCDEGGSRRERFHQVPLVVFDSETLLYRSGHRRDFQRLIARSNRDYGAGLSSEQCRPKAHMVEHVHVSFSSKPSINVTGQFGTTFRSISVLGHNASRAY